MLFLDVHASSGKGAGSGQGGAGGQRQVQPQGMPRSPQRRTELLNATRGIRNARARQRVMGRLGAGAPRS